MPGQPAGCRHQPVTHRADLPRRQSRRQIARNTDGHVYALFHQVHQAVRQRQLQVQRGKAVQQGRQPRRQPGLPEHHRRADPQQAMRRAAVVAGQRVHLLRGRHHARAGGVHRLPEFGQGKGARGPLQQACADGCFQPRHMAADGGGCHAKLAGGGGEAAAFHHPGEYGHGIELRDRHGWLLDL